MWVTIKKTYNHYWAQYNGRCYFPELMSEEELYQLRKNEVLHYRNIPLMERIMIKCLCNTIKMNLLNDEGFYRGIK